MLISLKSLIQELEGSKELNDFLTSFSCEKDSDIEYFLNNRAIEFEKLSKSRTYFICDEDDLMNKPLSEVAVYGYIALSLKILTVPEETSNRVRKEIDGLSAKIHGERINDFSCYLIGQLAKNSNISNNGISGAELIDIACNVIATSVDAVGGRCIMIECKDEEKLIKFYSNNGFNVISKIPDDNQVMVQMIRKI